MDTTIQDDFIDFVANESLFNCEVKLYTAKGEDPSYEGFAIFDKKPMLVDNGQGQVSYQGHKSLITFAMKDLTFMDAYFSLKGYYLEVTDNQGEKDYTIANSIFSSNVNSIMCELKEII
jgi:hypothetical protein